MAQLSSDLALEVCKHLSATELVALSCTCKFWKEAVEQPVVWAHLIRSSFLPDDLPQDLHLLAPGAATAAELCTWLQHLRLQRPAFRSTVRRACELQAHQEAVYQRVLRIDGRRDLNYTAIFRNLQPGHYRVVWRMQLRGGFTKGYINFKALFSLPRRKPKPKPCPPASASRGAGGRVETSGRAGVRVSGDGINAAAGGGASAIDVGRLPGLFTGLGAAWKRLGAQRGVLPPAAAVAGAAAGAEAGGAGQAAHAHHHQQQLQRAMGNIGRNSPPQRQPEGRFLPGCLALFLGSYTSCWKLLDPAGPLGTDGWQRVSVGTLTLRRPCDVHLHNVLVQMRTAQQMQQALLQGGGSLHRAAALVDYVELIPEQPATMLEGLMPACLYPDAAQQRGPHDLLMLPNL